MPTSISERVCLSLFVVGLAGCNGSRDDGSGLESPPTFTFTFDGGLDGWEVGFADYPAGASPEEQTAIDQFYELTSAHAPLPLPLDTADGAVMISGNNHSDDLFMFLKRRVGGLEPDTTHRLDLRIVIATNVPSDCLGVGGSPGEGVYVKGGAASIEPLRVIEPLQSRWVMNVDKGNQSQGGQDAQVLGNFANSKSCDSSDFSYELKTLTNFDLQPFEITTNSTGALWLLLGTDSAFEATTTIYYTEVEATFRR